MKTIITSVCLLAVLATYAQCVDPFNKNAALSTDTLLTDKGNLYFAIRKAKGTIAVLITSDEHKLRNTKRIEVLFTDGSTITLPNLKDGQKDVMTFKTEGMIKGNKFVWFDKQFNALSTKDISAIRLDKDYKVTNPQRFKSALTCVKETIL